MTRISVTREKRLLEDPGKEKFGSDGERRTIAWSTESTHDEREERINDRSTKDIRAPRCFGRLVCVILRLPRLRTLRSLRLRR